MSVRHAFAFVAVLSLAEMAAAECTWEGFRPAARFAATAATVLLVVDLDGDSAPEIITSGNQVEELAAFSILRNRGDGTFDAERLIPAGFGQTLQDAGDLDGDGISDLLASDYWSNGIAVYRGLGGLRFGGGTPYGTATHGGPSRIVDYDGDGTPDIVSLSFGSGNPVRVHLFRGHGDGSLESKRTFETGLANAASLSTTRVRGALELLAAEHSGHLGLMRIVTDGVVVSRLEAGPRLDLASTFADVNGDGIDDVVDTSEADSAAADDPLEHIYITLASPEGGFGARRQLARPRHTEFPVVVHAADVDADGRVDLVVSDFRSATLLVYHGDGTGDFAEAVPIDAGGPVNDFKIADVNRDGRPDLVTVNEDHSVSVLLNAGPCGGPRRRAVHP